jgi:hypothetical protein|nr:MAG TPA: hypothetical protein [Caudoviricetes sp.]
MKYEDDLMYASEAIQKIASEAMQRVENLYKLRFSVPRDPEPSDHTPTRTTPVVSGTPQTSDISVTETLRTPEKIDSSFDLVDNFMHNIPKSKPTVKPNLKPVSVTPIDQRPEKIDSNLHGLTL